MKAAVKRLVRRFGFTLVTSSHLDLLTRQAAIEQRLPQLDLVKEPDLRKALTLIQQSQSQLGQDILVLSHLGWKRDGYFVEFGATDGLTLSNTAMLEKQFGWRGILAEPARAWHTALAQSGRTAHIEHDCVWSETGKKLPFSETPWMEVSTLSQFSDQDNHALSRKNARQYLVKTVSLNDLLDRYNAPRTIDYLSIDTEGSEFEILSSLDFDLHRFRVITCEHNFTDKRDRILDLLTKNGYERRFTEVSSFDDWYFMDC